MKQSDIKIEQDRHDKEEIVYIKREKGILNKNNFLEESLYFQILPPSFLTNDFFI